MPWPLSMMLYKRLITQQSNRQPYSKEEENIQKQESSSQELCLNKSQLILLMMLQFLDAMFLVTVGEMLFVKRIQLGFAATKMNKLIQAHHTSTSFWQQILNLRLSKIEENMKKQEC